MTTHALQICYASQAGLVTGGCPDPAMALAAIINWPATAGWSPRLGAQISLEPRHTPDAAHLGSSHSSAWGATSRTAELRGRGQTAVQVCLRSSHEDAIPLDAVLASQHVPTGRPQILKAVSMSGSSFTEPPPPNHPRTAGWLEEAPAGTSQSSVVVAAANEARGSPVGTIPRRTLIGGVSLAVAMMAGAPAETPRAQGSEQGRAGHVSTRWPERALERFREGFGIGAAEAAPVRDAYDEAKLLEQNRRIQKLNNAPENFPGFLRDGFEVKVLIGPEWQTSPTGLIYLDLVPGTGASPTDGQQVIFHYIGYNESARRVDSTYYNGTPAKTRVGINGMIPGFEEGIKSMKVGGKRRIVIPPELGPPTGPSTFFSAKQYEVFDIELLATSDCVRRQIVFYSDVVCE